MSFFNKILSLALVVSLLPYSTRAGVFGKDEEEDRKVLTALIQPKQTRTYETYEVDWRTYPKIRPEVGETRDELDKRIKQHENLTFDTMIMNHDDCRKTPTIEVNEEIDQIIINGLRERKIRYDIIIRAYSMFPRAEDSYIGVFVDSSNYPLCFFGFTDEESKTCIQPGRR